MEKNTRSESGGKETGAAKVGWYVALRDTVRRCEEMEQDVTPETVAAGLAEAFGVSVGMATAMVQGCEVMAEYMCAEMSDDETSLDEEVAAIAASRRAFCGMFEVRLQERIDRVDGATKGQVSCRTCGQGAQSRGRLERIWLSALGPLRLKRRRSVCPEHKGARSLAQERLLLPEGDFTGHLAEAMSLMATTVPEGMATTLVGKLVGVEVSKHGVQGVVHERGQQVVALLDSDAAELRPWLENGFERDVSRPDDAVAKAPAVAYLEVDGVFPVTRKLDEAASQPVEGARGGKGLRYTLEGREVKNAVLYSGDACVQESDSRGSILDKRYVSRLGHWMLFAVLVWAAMLRLRFDQAKLLVLLSDGALWIRELAKWLPCNVFLILDLYHAKRRIWEVARALYGEKSAHTVRWATEQCLAVESGDVQSVIDRLCALKPKRKEVREKVDALSDYFVNNKDRMDYPSYRARGLRISSAAVESANYHVTGARLKQQGMRWSEKGAEEMAALRADLFNDVWEDRTRQLLRAAA